MVKFIFDLDYTLYGKNMFTEHNNEDVYYSSFHPSHFNFLKKLLKTIKEKKYILTNANEAHALLLLGPEKMNLLSIFSRILANDTISPYENYYKPDPIVFNEAIKRFKIKKNETVYFFEDTPENLEMAKRRYSWKTILISNTLPQDTTYIDYVFRDIETALMYFIRNLS